MSNYTKLVIDNQEVDLNIDDNLPLDLLLRIEDLDNNVAGGFSKSKIAIPATKKNRDIFTDSNAKLDFYIENNGSINYSGIATLVEDINTNFLYGSEVETFSIQLLLNNSNWINQLEGVELKDLVSEVINYSATNIIVGLTCLPDTYNFAFGWIKFNEWANSRTVSETDPISGATVNRTLESPSLFETTPLYFITPLIRAAFNSIGYTIESTFWDSEIMRRHVIALPLPEKLPVQYSDEYLNTSVSLDTILVDATNVSLVPVPYDTVDLAPTVGANPYNLGTYQFVTPAKGYYNIKMGGTFDPLISGTFDHVYIARIDVISGLISGDPNPIGFGTVSSALVPVAFPTGEYREAEGVLYLEKGAVLQVTQSHSSSVDFNVLDSFLTITGEAEVSEDVIFPFQYLFQDWKVLDMLSDLKQMYSLVFSPNEMTNTIKIEPSDGYRYTQRAYTDANQPDLAEVNEYREGFYKDVIADNWSQKVDYIPKSTTTYKELSQYKSYKFKEDGGDTLKFLNDANTPKVYDSIFDFGDSAFNTNTVAYESKFFVKTIHTFDSLTRYPYTTITPQFPLAYAEDFNYPLDPTATADDKRTSFSPMIMYFAGVRGGIDGYIELHENPSVPQPLPAIFQVNYNDTSGLDTVISWDNQEIQGVQRNGLIAKYLLRSLSRLKNRTTKVLYIRLDSIEANQLNYRVKRYIDGKVWIIKQIDIDAPFTNDSLKVTFVLDDSPTIDDYNNIQSSGLKGLANAI